MRIFLFFGWLLYQPFLYGNFDILEEATVASASHINTTIGGERFEDTAISALRQGALNAGVQTVSPCIANKIEDMADSKVGTEQIDDIIQEIFHGFLGAGIGAETAAIMGQDVGKGATSGAISAVVGHSTAKISGSKALGDLVAVAVAMMTDQDVGIAYMASNNATTYNYEAHQKQNTEAKGDEKEDEEVADGKKVSGRISPSIALNEGIEECTQGILQEQSLREGDLGFTKRVASYLREFKHKSSMNALGEMLYNRQVQKAADRLIDGTAVSSDKNLLAQTISLVAASTFSGGKSSVKAPIRTSFQKQVVAKSAAGKLKQSDQQGFKKLGGTGTELSAAGARRLLKGPNQVSSAPTVEGLAAKYSGKKAAEYEDVIMRPLLPGEGKVRSYGELKAYKKANDNLARHHMPNSQYMQSKGIPHSEGISMMVEQPVPGTGGRHRQIHKELIKQDPNLTPRDALAESVLRARKVYQADGVLSEIRPSLLEAIKANQTKFPGLFKKVGTDK